MLTIFSEPPLSVSRPLTLTASLVVAAHFKIQNRAGVTASVTDSQRFDACARRRSAPLWIVTAPETEPVPPKTPPLTETLPVVLVPLNSRVRALIVTGPRLLLPFRIWVDAPLLKSEPVPVMVPSKVLVPLPAASERPAVPCRTTPVVLPAASPGGDRFGDIVHIQRAAVVHGDAASSPETRRMVVAEHAAR